MKPRDVKLFLATFIAIFVVLSPAVQFLSLTGGDLPNAESAHQKSYPIKDRDLVGQSAPNPIMSYMNGENAELEDFRGSTVIFYLWSTWSPVVPKDLWYLNQLHLKHGDSQVQVLAANIGFRDRLEEIERYINRRNLDLPVVLCTPDVMAQFSVRGVPALFIIDQEGVVRYEALGEMDEVEFKKALDKVTATSVSPSTPNAVQGNPATTIDKGNSSNRAEPQTTD